MSRTLPVNRFTTTAQGLVPAPGTSNGWALIDTGAWGVVPTSGLGTGTADSTKFLRGDGTWSNALTGAFSVAGTSTFASGTFSGTLGVTGATTLAAMTATTGSFSSTLGVTGAFTVTPAGGQFAINSAGNVTIGGPSSGTGLFVSGGIAAASPGWSAAGGVASWLNGTSAAPGGFKVSFGGNVGFDGANWRTATDGASNGGYLIGESYGGGGVSFYTVASTGGTSQTISNATMDSLRRFNLDAAGNFASFYYNNAAYGAGTNATANINLNNASTTMQTSVEFQKAGVINGRIRNDYAGNMTYVATGSGGHYFFTGGDSGTGSPVLIISAGGALAVTLAATTTSPAAGGAGALPATPAGYAAITINGTARRIPYYT